MSNEEKIKDLKELAVVKKQRIWEPFMRKYNCDVICEVGVFKGNNFSQMVKHNPKEAVAVDAWLDDGIRSRNDYGSPQADLDKFYAHFKEWYKDNPAVKVERGYTFDVVKKYPDEYFDFVYVDADHTFEGCLRDIQDWYPKVKKGGVLAGDDFRESTYWPGVTYGVIEAVNKFSKDNNLEFSEIPRYGWVIIKN